MASKLAFLSLLGICNVVAGRYFSEIRKYNLTDTGSKDLDTILEILRKPRVPEKYQSGFMVTPTNGFDWKSCGTSNDIVTFDKISVEPDELVFPGKVTVSVSGKINTDLPSPIKVEVDLKKKVDEAWVQIPCISQIGSCTYDDMCVMFEKLCPAPMPCKCPFKAGPINIPSTTKDVKYQIPSGDYKMNLKATHNDKEVLCLDMSVAIG